MGTVDLIPTFYATKQLSLRVLIMIVVERRAPNPVRESHLPLLLRNANTPNGK